MKATLRNFYREQKLMKKRKRMDKTHGWYRITKLENKSFHWAMMLTMMMTMMMTVTQALCGMLATDDDNDDDCDDDNYNYYYNYKKWPDPELLDF